VTGHRINLDDLKIDPAIGYKVHPIAAAFPRMPGDELAALVKDIREHGLRHPIDFELYKDEKIIVEGLTRLVACKQAGVKPRFHQVTFKSDEELSAYVWSQNVHRRHLTPSQLAIWLVQRTELVAQIAQESAARRKKTQGRPKGGEKKTDGKVAGGTTAGKLASVAKGQVSERTLRDAQAVVSAGDKELIGAVESGKKSVSAAAKEARQKKPRAPSKAPSKSKLKSTPKPKPKSKTRAAAERQARVQKAAAQLLETEGDVFCRELIDALRGLLGEPS
jgi:hypothetical protein